MKQDTRVWVYILIWNVNFLHKNNVVSQTALAMGLDGICITEKILRKWRNMVSLDIYIFLQNYVFKISHFLYKHNYIVSMEGSSMVLHIECLGDMFLLEIFKKWHNLMSFSEYSDKILS